MIKKILDKKNKKTQILRYLPVAVIATIFDTVTLFLLVTYLKVHYLIGAGFGILIGLIVNQILCIYFVFEKRSFKLKKEISFLLVIAGVALLLTLWFMFVFTDIFRVYYIFSKEITICIVFFWNFLARKYILFK